MKDRSVREFFAEPLEFKVSAIEPIVRRFPERRFIFVGDSGEQDPEAYAAGLLVSETGRGNFDP